MEQIPIVPPRHKTKWTEEEDLKLLSIVECYGKGNWRKISEIMGNKNGIQCFHRYNRLSNNNIKQGSWTKEEDILLKNLYNQYGKRWTKISKIMRYRNPNQIRERYQNILDENVNKSKFTVEEDQMLIRLYLKYGRSWTKISKYFLGRTPDKIKTRFYTNILKKYGKLEDFDYSILKNEESNNKNFSEVIKLREDFLEGRINFNLTMEDQNSNKVSQVKVLSENDQIKQYPFVISKKNKINNFNSSNNSLRGHFSDLLNSNKKSAFSITNPKLIPDNFIYNNPKTIDFSINSNSKTKCKNFNLDEGHEKELNQQDQRANLLLLVDNKPVVKDQAAMIYDKIISIKLKIIDIFGSIEYKSSLTPEILKFMLVLNNNIDDILVQSKFEFDKNNYLTNQFSDIGMSMNDIFYLNDLNQLIGCIFNNIISSSSGLCINNDSIKSINHLVEIKDIENMKDILKQQQENLIQENQKSHENMLNYLGYLSSAGYTPERSSDIESSNNLNQAEIRNFNSFITQCNQNCQDSFNEQLLRNPDVKQSKIYN